MLNTLKGRVLVLSLYLVAIIALPLEIFSGQNITVQWNASPEPDITRYRLYLGQKSRAYTQHIDVNAPATSAVASNLTDGQLYFFAVTAWSAAGLESAYSSEVQFTVPRPAPNVAPTLDSIANISMQEDAAPLIIALKGITPGGAYEIQPLTVKVVSSNPSVIPAPVVSYTSPNKTGALTLAPLPNAYGTATITVTVSDGQSANSTVSRSFIVTVNPVNDPATLDPMSTLVLTQNAAARSVPLTGITSGASNEIQPLRVTATSSNPTLLPAPSVAYTTPSATGTLVLKPAANRSGIATVTVSVYDTALPLGAFTRSFSVIINNPPTLDALASLTINQDAGTQTVELHGISSGASTEAQPVQITATSSNPALIPHPAVSYATPAAKGQLTFKPVAGASGTAIITVAANDGQPANNITTRSFTVTVKAGTQAAPANLAPTLDPIASFALKQNSGSQRIMLSGISAGSPTEAQPLSVSATSSDPDLVHPAVSYDSPDPTGILSLVAAADAAGSAVITVTVHDGEALNGSTAQSFTVTVESAAKATNVAPTLDIIADLILDANSGTQTVSLSGITSGSSSEAQLLSVSATSSNPGLIPNPVVSYASPDATGELSFTPAANNAGSAIITVTVEDGEAENGSVSRSFTVTVNKAVNASPTLDSLSDLSLAEGAGTQTINLSGITSGSPNETQTLAISVVSSNPALIPSPAISYSSPSSTGVLTLQPAAGASGEAVITVTVNDGETVNSTFSRSFTVTVSPANDQDKGATIENLVVASSDARTLVLSWQTSKAVTSWLEFGATTALGSTNQQSVGMDHVSVLSNLQPGTAYYMRVVAMDDQGNTSSTELSSASTPKVNLLTWAGEKAALSGPMSAGSDAGALDRAYLSTGAAAGGTATYKVELPEGLVYQAWCRVKTTAGGGSIGISVDGDEELQAVIADDGSGAWRWVRLALSGAASDLFLIDGHHQIVLRGMAGDIWIDEICLSNDSTWQPLSDGLVPALSVTRGAGMSVDLTWSGLASDVQGYAIQAGSVANGFKLIATVGANARFYNVSSLTAAFNGYRIFAFNASDRSAYSAATTTSYAKGQSIAAPRAVSAQVQGNGSILVSWVSGAVNLTGFILERSSDGVNFTSIRTLGSGALSATDTPAPGRYYYRVRSVSGTEESNAAETVSVLL